MDRRSFLIGAGSILTKTFIWIGSFATYVAISIMRTRTYFIVMVSRKIEC